MLQRLLCGFGYFCLLILVVDGNLSAQTIKTNKKVYSTKDSIFVTYYYKYESLKGGEMSTPFISISPIGDIQQSGYESNAYKAPTDTKRLAPGRLKPATYTVELVNYPGPDPNKSSVIAKCSFTILDENSSVTRTGKGTLKSSDSLP